MRTPGIDVRPIKAMDGNYHNCEVFYDNVRIPLSNVVGEIDNGWSVTMTTFGFERGSATFGGICEMIVLIDELIALARQKPAWGGPPPIEDGSIAVRLGEQRARIESLRRLMSIWVPKPRSSICRSAKPCKRWAGWLWTLPAPPASAAAHNRTGPRPISTRSAQRWRAEPPKSCATSSVSGCSACRADIGRRMQCGTSCPAMTSG
jgi:alkylation response protein AidB-like acyl-CoA dehydrogenase